MNSRHLAFDELVLQAIDESLSILGEEPKSALYQYLTTIHRLQREEIPTKIGQFVVGLKRALGAASKIVEKLTLRKLYEKIGGTYQEVQGFEFADYVEDARQKFGVLRPSTTEPGDPSEYGHSKKAQFSG